MAKAESKKKSEKKDSSQQITITISKDDEYLNEILSRVKVEKDFVKEAMYFYDRFLHANRRYISSRFLKLKKEEDVDYEDLEGYKTIRGNQQNEITYKEAITFKQTEKEEKPLNDIKEDTNEEIEYNNKDAIPGFEDPPNMNSPL